MLRLQEILKILKIMSFCLKFWDFIHDTLNIIFRVLPNFDQTSSLPGWKLYTKTLFLGKIILDIFVHAKLWLIPFTLILKPNFKFWYRVMTAIWKMTKPSFDEKFFLFKDSMILCYFSPLTNLPLIIGSQLLVWLTKW